MPVLWAIEEYEPYATLVVDREHARIILSYLGRSAVVEKKALWLNIRQWRFATGRPPTSTRRVGIGAGRGTQRDEFEARVEDHVRRFWAGTAVATDRFLRESRIDRLIMGGPQEATSAVRDLLPKASRDKVVGLVHLPAQAELAEIHALTLPVALAEESRQEAKVIETLLERTAAARGGVIGLARTLEALNERQVLILVLDRDLDTDVWQCPKCGYVTRDQTATCPVCGTRMERTALSQVLPILARRNGARIELVSREAATTLQDAIAALLRYVPKDAP